MPTSQNPPDVAVTFDALDVRPDMPEVLRYMGYPNGAAPAAAMLGRIEQAVASAQFRPKGLYAVHSLTAGDRQSLTLGGGAVIQGVIGKFLGDATRIAVVVATAGPEVVEASRAAWQRHDAVGALALDALGSQIADSAADAVCEQLGERLQPTEIMFAPL